MTIDLEDPLAGLTGKRARFGFDVDTTAPELPSVDGVLAGAVVVDITPPPGMPKAGYSSNATDGVGFRTRLQARIVHLRAGTGSIAIVHCDLLGGSSIVQHLVARRLAGSTDIPLSGLWIGATHTHAGPGQFLGSDFYNRFASNRPGFDPDWTAFLVDQIAGGVESAVRDRSPAKVAFGTTDVWGATRNRSLEPHARNPEHDDRTEVHRRYTQIEPRLHLLRVDRIDGDSTRPLAASIVFSIHGTGVSQREDEYNADLWSAVVDGVADDVQERTNVRPVVGAMEGTHGDMTPALRPGRAGYVEARRVGLEVARAASSLHDRLGAELVEDAEIGAGLRDVDLRRDRTIDNVTLPRRAVVGAALAAGAKENETPVIGGLWPFRAGVPRRRARGGHGVKRALLGRLFQRTYFPVSGFPRVLPLQMLRVAGALYVGVPFEVTMAAGRRFEEAIGASIDGSGVDQVVVSSVVNDYVGYVTTPEEYQLQYYEGGHTIYGPNTHPFLAAHLARMGSELTSRGAVHDPLGRRDFDLRSGAFFATPAAGPGDERTIVSAPRFVDLSADDDAYWELRWTGGPPGDLRWFEPIVRIDARDGSDWFALADDGDGSIAVRHDGERRGLHRYAARWYRPDLRVDRTYRFVLEANNGCPAVVGEPFD